MKKSQKSMLILGGLVLAGVIYLATKKPSTGGGIPNDPIPQVPGSSVDEFERGSPAVAGRYNPHRQRKSWTV